LDLNYAYQSHAPSTWWGVAILSKYPIVSAEGMSVPSSSCGGRNALIGTVDINGRLVTFINAHLCDNMAMNDGSAVKKIMRKANSIEEPLVLIGDLNIAPRNWRVELLERRFLDTAKAAGKSTIGTWGGMGYRIDYVFVDPQHFEVHHVGLTPMEHWGASDHQGYYAIITLKSDTVKFEERTVSQEMVPMPRPEYSAGYNRHTIKDGQADVTSVVTVQHDNTISWRRNSEAGCTFTIVDYFGPEKEGVDCDGWSDTRNVICKTGDIWPLKVGNEVKFWYDLSCSPLASPPRQRRACKVEKQARIQTVSGEHDTFKVVCTDENDTHTWWMSAKLKDVVRYKQVHFRRGISVTETTKIEWP